jgi:hypothetical protein
MNEKKILKSAATAATAATAAAAAPRHSGFEVNKISVG